MSRTWRIEITEWLVDGSSRGWSLNSEIETDGFPAVRDRVHVVSPEHQPLEAVVTGVVLSDDNARVVVFAEVRA